MTVEIYGVIVCSHCKRVWGIDLSQKNSKCPMCNKKYIVKKHKVLYSTLDLRR